MTTPIKDPAVEAARYNALMDPFMELAQSIHDEAYTNGFADAKYDDADVEYDRDDLIERLDGECRRDSWYEGLEHDAMSKFEALLAHEATQAQALADALGRVDALTEAVEFAFFEVVGRTLGMETKKNVWQWPETAPEHVSILAESLRALLAYKGS